MSVWAWFIGDLVPTAVMAFIAVAAAHAAGRTVTAVVREGLADRVRAQAYVRRRAAYDAQMERTVPLGQVGDR